MAFPIYICSEEVRRQIPEILQAHGIKVEFRDLSNEPLLGNSFNFICSRGLGRISLIGHFDNDAEKYEVYMTVTHAVFWCSDIKLIGRVEKILLESGVVFSEVNDDE